jgi:hypothetical protein
MSKKLFRYLMDEYAGTGKVSLRGVKWDTPIQIDDQDDNDTLVQFCNMWVNVYAMGRMELEIWGNFPCTDEVRACIARFGGRYSSQRKSLILFIRVREIELLLEMADLFERLSSMPNKNVEWSTGYRNPSWHSVALRTAGSLRRFVNTVLQYRRLRDVGAL